MNLDEFLNDCHANVCEDDVERTDKLIALVRKLREQRDSEVRYSATSSGASDAEIVDHYDAALDEIVREG